VPEPVRLLIAEDQYLTREGTRRLLEGAAGVEVVGTAADYDAVLREASRLRPDVVLMDIKMPPTETVEGIRAAHIIKAERPETGILILSQHDDESYVWSLLEKGVEGYGYLHKVRVGDVDQLVRAIKEVAAGGSVLDPRILRKVLAHRAGKPGSPLAELTQGERDVVRLMAEGRSNAAIAGALTVSVGTVEKRIANVFSKLELIEEVDVNRRVAAVLIYLRETMPGR
jgi:DNA-binding NarL/FixJ family response regulator